MGMFSPDIVSIYGPGVRRTDSTGVEKVQILDKEYTLDSLGLSYGPKITENLIDAIFNPLPTTDKDKEGPFTYYVDPNSISTSTEDETVSPSPSSPSSESNSNDRISRTSHPAHADSVSVYSTESSASESHRSHRSHQSTTSTHSSLGIGLGVGLPSVGGMSVSEQRRGSGESYNSSDGGVAEPVGRMKGWWRKLGHGHTHEHQVPDAGASSMDRQDTIMPTIVPSPSMPAISITT
ncbi:hypothetical protein ONZ45_g13721 [Pleurotus djamor]|nr:hypothetical protein ONZ45_g13721 [Pleurotus djamor]